MIAVMVEVVAVRMVGGCGCCGGFIWKPEVGILWPFELAYKGGGWGGLSGYSKGTQLHSLDN